MSFLTSKTSTISAYISSGRESLYIAFAFILPVYLPLLNTIIILLSAIFIVDVVKKNIRLKADFSIFLLPVIFFIYAFTLLYSQDFLTGISKLETKSWLLAFPILICFYSLSDKLLQNIKVAFILGCLAACLICIVNALYVGYVRTEEIVFAENQYFYDRDFFVSAIKLHPPYFGLYLASAILFILDFKSNRINAVLKLVAQIVVAAILLVTLLLIHARMAQLALLFVFALKLVIYSLRNRKFIIPFTGFILVASLTLVTFKHPFFNKRVTELFKTPLREPTVHESNSVSLRYAQLYCSIQLIYRNPILGVGVGDAQQELNTCYTSRNYHPILARSNMNAHNQYLDIAISAGILGLVTFVSIFALLLYRFYPANKTVFLFVIIIGLSALSESIFNTYKGIVFFSFFCSVFIAGVNLRKRTDISYQLHT